MRVKWFIVSLVARLFGLLGLGAAGIFGLRAYEAWFDGSLFVPMTTFTLLGGALFCALKGFQFLIPRFHNIALFRRRFSRFVFVVLSLGWLLVSCGAVLELVRQNGLSGSMIAQGALIGSVVALVLYVFFYIWGASFQIAERQLAWLGDPDEPLIEYRANQKNPAPGEIARQQAKRYQAQAFKIDPKTQLRRRDMWDALATLLLIAGAIGGLVAYRFGNTVQTAELNQLIYANLVAMFVIVTVIFTAPMVISSALRPPANKGMAEMGGFRRFVYAMFAAPFLGAILTLVIPFDAAPQVYNLVTDNPEATMLYEVVELERTGRIRDCVRLEPIGAPGTEVVNCGFGAEFNASLREGNLLEVTGELSRFGHTMSDVTVLR